MRIDFRACRPGAAAAALALGCATVLPVRAGVLQQDPPGGPAAVQATRSPQGAWAVAPAEPFGPVTGGPATHVGWWGTAGAPGHPGILHHGADLPFSLALTADTVYGLTVAQAGAGWPWADAADAADAADPPERPTAGSARRDAPTGAAFGSHSVPEPATLAMVGLALAWLVAARRPKVDAEAAPGPTG